MNRQEFSERRTKFWNDEQNGREAIMREFGKELLRTKKIGGKRKLYRVVDENGNIQVKGKLVKIWAKIKKEAIKEERIVRPALPQLTNEKGASRSIDDMKKRVALYTSRYEKKKEVFSDCPLGGEATKEWEAGFYKRMEFIPEKESGRGEISQNDENREILESYFMAVGLWDECD